MEIKKNEDVESKFVQKTLIASGISYGFYHVDFTVGGKLIQNYEALEPIRPCPLEFEECLLVPLMEIESKNNLWTFLCYFYGAALDRFAIGFPHFDISLENPNFKDQVEEKLKEFLDFPIKNIEFLDNFLQTPNVYSDPAACSKRSRVVTIKLKFSEADLRALEGNKKIELVEIEGNLCEKFKKIAEERSAILIDKSWYWAFGRSFREKDIFQQ